MNGLQEQPILKDVQNVNHVTGTDQKKTKVLKINSPKYGIKKVLIDDEDYEKIKKFGWCIEYNKKSKNFRVVSTKKIYKSRKNLHFRLHRVIMDAPKNMEVDHINHNQLDNRKCNLRICTRSQNQRNTPKSIKNTSGYKGVFLLKNKYIMAQIKINSKTKYLGLFKNLKDAAIAYNNAALKYHGEFAYLNKI